MGWERRRPLTSSSTSPALSCRGSSASEGSTSLGTSPLACPARDHLERHGLNPPECEMRSLWGAIPILLFHQRIPRTFLLLSCCSQLPAPVCKLTCLLPVLPRDATSCSTETVEKVINVGHSTTSRFGLSGAAMCCIWGCGKSGRGQW